MSTSQDMAEESARVIEGDVEARKRIVEQNLGLVFFILMRYRKTHVDYRDMETHTKKTGETSDAW